MDQRSIDFAKTASVDLMTLNNTVVNMRQVVRRARVHVINKLCRHINKLKKKKGTDEQKAKNIRKAERYLDEIDSMKKLKEDKVSKFALANTASFSEVSKTCLLSGPRAMARLADHPLLKKVITEFREKHSDWRELAAYLLVKQTGRRFKTKKQKQQKRAKCVENIDASKTMTKTYIQERFGQEGLTKAEERFKRKRRLTKLDSSSEAVGSVGQKSELAAVSSQIGQNSDGHNDRSDNVSESFKEKSEKPLLQQKDDIDEDISSEENYGDDGDESSEENKEEMEVSANMEVDRNSSEQESESDAEGEENNNDESDEDDDVESGEKEESADEKNTKYLQNSQRGVKIQKISKSRKEGSIQENKNKQSVQTGAKMVSHKQVSLSDGTTEGSGSRAESTGNKIKSQRPKKSECVVKQLNLGSDDDDDDSESDASSSSNSEENSEESGEDEELKSADSETSDTKNHQDKPKGKKRKTSKVPEFLTKVSKTPISDPFFVGSDDDDTNVTFDDNNFGFNSDNNEDLNDDEEGGDSKAKSCFYQPHWRSMDTMSRGQGSYRVNGHRGGGFRTQNNLGKFDRQPRFRSFRGNNRNSASIRESRFQSSDRQRFGHRNKNNQGDKSSAQKDRPEHKKVSTQQTNRPVHKGLGSSQVPEKLHPSWEASKKRKAEQSSLKAFTGSRITFDDD